jgi:lysozyme
MFNPDNLVVEIKENEGFRGEVYKDHLGFDTVGYGTKMPLSKKEATVLLRMRLYDKAEELATVKPLFNQLPEDVQNVLAEMAYQLGVGGLLKFRKMWKHIEAYEFDKASVEGLDSLWAKQTPSRANKLMEHLGSING